MKCKVATSLVWLLILFGCCDENSELGAANTTDIVIEHPVGNRYSLVYEGGFRFQKGSFGQGGVSYGGGAFAVDERNSRIWINGRVKHFSIGAYELPAPVSALDVADLPIAKNVQPFVQLSPLVVSRPGRAPDRITGMSLLDGRLLVNATIYYDASATNKDTTMLIESPADLSDSRQLGYFQMDGSAHSAGWVTAIPANARESLGGDVIAGYASNIPVDSRHSIGPSLFVWNSADIVEGSIRIPATPLIDYSLANRLHDDGYNKTGENSLWTVVSKAFIGFIPPGSSDYLVIGTSGGHESKLGYKIEQDNGRRCGGPCAYAHKDYYNYFWRYTLDDALRVRAGVLAPHDPRPVEYGQLGVSSNELRPGYLMSAAAFSPTSGRLYLLFGNADGLQSKYETLPVMLVYSLWVNLDDGSRRPVVPEKTDGR
jgi:hypothetical protein